MRSFVFLFGIALLSSCATTSSTTSYTSTTDVGSTGLYDNSTAAGQPDVADEPAKNPAPEGGFYVEFSGPTVVILDEDESKPPYVCSVPNYVACCQPMYDDLEKPDGIGAAAIGMDNPSAIPTNPTCDGPWSAAAVVSCMEPRCIEHDRSFPLTIVGPGTLTVLYGEGRVWFSGGIDPEMLSRHYGVSESGWRTTTLYSTSDQEYDDATTYDASSCPVHGN